MIKKIVPILIKLPSLPRLFQITSVPQRGGSIFPKYDRDVATSRNYKVNSVYGISKSAKTTLTALNHEKLSCTSYVFFSFLIPKAASKAEFILLTAKVCDYAKIRLQ